MPRLAFIGSGRMAGAMVRGLLRSGAAAPGEITVIGGDDSTAADLSKATGVRVAVTPAELLAGADAVVLACKPQQFAALDRSYASLTQGKLVLSILAGTRLATLGAFFASARNIARAMPNTPGAVGQGISARCSATPLAAADARIVDAMLAGLGPVLELPEPMFDAVTAVSGSGPGFFFEYVAAYEQAAVGLGFTPEQARLLVRQTFSGSLALLAATGETPENLRNQVTSPGGTTRAGLDALEAGKFRDVVASALLAARKRGEELGKA
ncbi:MAG: pyrroline-5-carboxylate reductase [Opitutia bacterium]